MITYKYFITPKLAKLLEQRLKLKSHLIDLLIEICSMILSNVEPIDSNIGSFSIQYNKMGRVFFNLKDRDGLEFRHFSFNFPFTIREKGEGRELYSSVTKIKIESEYIAILRTIAASDGFNERESNYGVLLSFSQLVEESIAGLGLSAVSYERVIDNIIFELFTFEPGYIRYDFDPVNPDEKLHPLHHLDLFFSQRTTFKIGLREPLSANQFSDLLDSTTDCKYM